MDRGATSLRSTSSRASLVTRNSRAASVTVLPSPNLSWRNAEPRYSAASAFKTTAPRFATPHNPTPPPRAAASARLRRSSPTQTLPPQTHPPGPAILRLAGPGRPRRSGSCPRTASATQRPFAARRDSGSPRGLLATSCGNSPSLNSSEAPSAPRSLSDRLPLDQGARKSRRYPSTGPVPWASRSRLAGHARPSWRHRRRAPQGATWGNEQCSQAIWEALHGTPRDYSEISGGFNRECLNHANATRLCSDAERERRGRRRPSARSLGSAQRPGRSNIRSRRNER